MKSTFKWSLIVMSLAMSSAVAIAQPDPPPGNPPQPNNRPQGPNRPRMTPEEQRKQSEDRLREVMTSNGVTDASTQDAVLTYLSNELDARQPLRQMGGKLYRALEDQSVSDDQIKGMIADYQNAQDLEKQRRIKAQSDLENKIHYSQNPRLEGLLMLMGVLGNGPPLMEGPRKPRGEDDRPNPKMGNEGGGNPEMRQKMLQMFDKNGNGKLDPDERAAAQAYRQEHGNKQNGNQAPPPQAPANNAGNDQMNDDN